MCVSEVTEINNYHLTEIWFLSPEGLITQTTVLAERWKTVAMVPREMKMWLNRGGERQIPKITDGKFFCSTYLKFPFSVPSHMFFSIRFCQGQLCVSETQKPLYNVVETLSSVNMIHDNNSYRIMLISEP